MDCNMDCLNCYFPECLHDLSKGAQNKAILTAPDEALSKKGKKRRESLQKKQEKRVEKLEKNREYQRNWYQQKKQAKKEQMEEEQMQEEKKTEALTEEEKLAKKKAYQAEYYQRNRERLDAKRKEAKAKKNAEKKAAEDQLERIQRMRSTYGLGKEKEPAAEVEEEKAEPVMETARVIPAEAIREVEATEAQAEEEEMEEFVFIEKPEETEESTQTEARKLPDTVKLEMPIGTAESLYIFLQDEILRVVKRDDVEELEWVADMCDIYRELKGVLMGK